VDEQTTDRALGLQVEVYYFIMGLTLKGHACVPLQE